MSDAAHEMLANCFLDKARPPTSNEVRAALGRCAAHLDALIAAVPSPHSETWKHYGKTAGWTLKLGAGARNLCFVVVRPRCFTVAFVMGDRAVAAVEASPLPREIVHELVSARRYAEGRGIRVLVRTRQDLRSVLTLLAIKRAH